MNSITLVKAAPEHVDLLFDWANDPVTRAHSFSSAVIPREAHDSWYARLLADPSRRLWIAYSGETPIGCFRLDPLGAEAVVSVTIAPLHRGQGLGTAVILLGSALSTVPINAYIKPDNTASLVAFERAGYQRVLSCEIKDPPALLLKRRGEGD